VLLYILVSSGLSRQTQMGHVGSDVELCHSVIGRIII
jgi:hypothetical protein